MSARGWITEWFAIHHCYLEYDTWWENKRHCSPFPGKGLMMSRIDNRRRIWHSVSVLKGKVCRFFPEYRVSYLMKVKIRLCAPRLGLSLSKNFSVIHAVIVKQHLVKVDRLSNAIATMRHAHGVLPMLYAIYYQVRNILPCAQYITKYAIHYQVCYILPSTQ